MIHLRTRNEIMAWLEKYAPTPTIARAMQEGKTELLGVFKRIPPKCEMGWVVAVTSKHGITYHVAIKPNQLRGGYWCHMVSRVPWEQWMGDVLSPLDKLHNTIYKGDNPEIYEELKNVETKK